MHTEIEFDLGLRTTRASSDLTAIRQMKNEHIGCGQIQWFRYTCLQVADLTQLIIVDARNLRAVDLFGRIVPVSLHHGRDLGLSVHPLLGQGN